MEEAINEALRLRQNIIWIQDCSDENDDNDCIGIAKIYSPFEKLSKDEFSGERNIKQSGFIFYSYVSMDNEENILNQHGRMELCQEENLPVLTSQEWQGKWIEVDFNLLGKRDGLSEGKKITLSSEIGQVPEDGGDYLIFVLFMKKIANSSLTPLQKREWVEAGYKFTGVGGEKFSNYLSMIGKDIDEVISKL